MVWEIPWETETVLDLVTQEPGRKLLELRQDLEEIRKNIASPIVQRLAAADYNLDSIYASLEGNAAGKLFQAANHYQQVVSKLIDQAQSNLAVADTHLDNMLMRIDEAAEQAGSGQGGTSTGGTVGAALRIGPPGGSEPSLVAGEIEHIKTPCYNYKHGGMSNGLYIRWGHYPTEQLAKLKAEEIASQYPSDWEISKWTEGVTAKVNGENRLVYDAVVRVCPPPGVDPDEFVQPHETTPPDGKQPTPVTTPVPSPGPGPGPEPGPSPAPQPGTCPPPQVSCPAPQVTCPTPTIQVVLQCPAGGPPLGPGPTPTPTPIGPPGGPPGSGGPPIGIGPPGTGGPPIGIPPFPGPPFGGPPIGIGPPGTGGPPIGIPPFPGPPFGGPPIGIGQPGSGGPPVGISPPGKTTPGTPPKGGDSPGGPSAGTGGCILPVLQPGSIVRHYEQGNNFDDMKLKGDSIVAGAKTAKPEGQFSYMICQCGQTFILIVFEVVTADAGKCPELVAESGEKPKAEFEVTSLPRRDEDQPCWDIYPVGGDMFRLAWEYFRNKQQAANVLSQLKLEPP